jgi:hypothetical protein
MGNRAYTGFRLLILASLLFAACSIEEPGTRVDNRFVETYYQLRWKDKNILGEPISVVMVDNETGLERQVFHNGVLAYDPRSARFYLEPVGKHLTEYEETKKLPDSAFKSKRRIGGVRTIQEFAAAYQAIGGQRWVGKPISEVYEAEAGMIRQDFEGLSFYRFESDPAGVVRFYPYGYLYNYDLEELDQKKYTIVEGELPETSTPEQPTPATIEAIALEHLTRSFLGSSLSKAYPGEDGRKEIVFDNVVVYEDPESPLGISLRAIGRYYYTSRPIPRADQEGMVFRVVRGNKGYLVPTYFHQFIRSHGGYELAGYPISDVLELEKGITNQCFENYCLQYVPDAPPEAQVSVIPLGKEYHKFPFPTPTNTGYFEIGVWHFSQVVNPTDRQQIGVCGSMDGKPLTNFQATLYVNLPDQTQVAHDLPAPDQGGCVYYLLDPVQGNQGEEVSYRVCARTKEGNEICETDAFTIWGNP